VVALWVLLLLLQRVGAFALPLFMETLFLFMAHVVGVAGPLFGSGELLGRVAALAGVGV